MKAQPVGTTILSAPFWVADHGLAVGGLVLVVLGATAWPLALPLGWTALGLAFFAWVAEAEGIALPRLGRMAVRTYGCWDTPLAFTARRRHAVLLFTREEDLERGGWSDTYTVRERPAGDGSDPKFDLPLAPTNDWSLRGRTPVASLCFEHHERVCYVQRGSLERALISAGI